MCGGACRVLLSRPSLNILEPDAGEGMLAAAFVALALVVAGGFVAGVWGAWRAADDTRARAGRAALVAGAVTASWLALTAGAAAAGVLSFTTTPPTMMLLLAVMLALAIGLGVSRVGARLAVGLPLAVLVGFHAFRLPLELIMHRAYEMELMPVQMSYAGLNFDIVTGVTAVIVAALLAVRRLPLAVVRLWNALGFVLLANIVIISILSAPLPFRMFWNEPANVWVTRVPWVWLPAVLVLAALLGHIVVYRRLRAERGGLSARRRDRPVPP
jgi:hypothetical protein